MIDLDEAVRLAAEALHSDLVHRGYGLDDAVCACRSDADTAVTAALPALAEQFAALIEAAADLPGADEFYGTVAEGLHAAARLVRGSGVTG